MLILAGAFGGAFVFKSLCGYAPGLLTDWHIFWWFYTWGWKGAIHGEAWGWIIELTPAFFGAGMLSGLNASWSFMIGGILAWGLIGPLTIKYGVAVSKPISSAIPEYRNYFSMSAANNDFVNGGSPRYWLMWVSRLVIVILTYGAPNVLSHSAWYHDHVVLLVRRNRRFSTHLLALVQASIPLHQV